LIAAAINFPFFAFVKVVAVSNIRLLRKTRLMKPVLFSARYLRCIWPSQTVGPATAAAVTAAVLTLAGCANYAGIHSDKTPLHAQALESSRSLPAQGGVWPSLDWAAQFGDPQLPHLIDEAIADSPSIAQAQARVAKAGSYIESARATTLPRVDAKYSWTRERFSANGIYPPPFGGQWFGENNGLLNASYELDLWGKNREKVRSALSQEKAAEADAQQARITLATSVARTYNQLAQLYALRDIALQELTNRQEVRKIADGRVLAGLDTEVERRTAEGNVASTRSSVSDLDGQITTTRYALGALLGKGPDRGLEIQQPTLGPGGDVALPANLPADLLSRRADMVAARWQVDATQHDIKVAKAEFFPDINLSAAIGLDALGWSRFLNLSSRQISAGPAIHLPIFEGGALRAQLKDKYSDYDSAVAYYDQTLIDALNDVATQVASIRSIDRQMGDAQHAYDASRRAYELAVIRYKAGLSPQLQVLQADVQQLSQLQAVTNLKMRRRDLQVALIRALGGGFDAAGTALAQNTAATTRSASNGPVETKPSHEDGASAGSSESLGRSGS
jgi:NodT family efflux transporter outer membrane factor (OMF) lipoprotein